MTSTDVPAAEHQLSEPEITTALDVARALTRSGIPIFVAPPETGPESQSGAGFRLPGRWQETVPDEQVVSRWAPGWALCAVMGHGFDVLDVDPRNGGLPSLQSMNGTTPDSYALADTPSGGGHLWITSLGLGKVTNLLPGIDLQAGAPDGTGRGFVFLPPTVRRSKADGVLKPYRWAALPDLDRWWALRGGDRSGDGLRRLISERASQVRDARVSDSWSPGYREMSLNKAPQAEAAARRAIEEKLRAVRDIAPGAGGARHAILTAAYTLGGYVGGGYLDEDEAAEALREAITEVWPGPDTEDELWIAQGLGDGQGDPFYVYTPAQEAIWAAEGGHGGERDEPGAPAPLAAGSLIPPRWSVFTAVGTEEFEPFGTDQEQAGQVLLRMMPALRWSEASGMWLSRSADRWTERADKSGWAVAMVSWLMPLGDGDRPKDKSDWTREHWRSYAREQYQSSAGSAKIVKKVKDLCRDDQAPWTANITELDADPEVLWAGGWPFSLRRSVESPVVADWIDPNTPHIHTASVVPAPVDTPYWSAFTEAVWPDEDVRAWALRVLSICLTGYPDAALPVLWGRERSGKSSMVSLISQVLGTYGIAADARLLASADNTHASIIYALKGARLAFVDEGPRKGSLATERLKQITGGAALTGNPMRGNPVVFNPTHTLVLTTNEEPPLIDPALRARMRMIPCESAEESVRPLRQALADPRVWAAEAPGILAQLMAEAARWLGERNSASNAAAPQWLREDALSMQVGQSPVAAWIEERCAPADPGTPGRTLWYAYAAWLEASLIHKRTPLVSETAFGRALTDLGYHQAKLSGIKYRPLRVTGGAPVTLLGPVGGSGQSGQFQDSSGPQLSLAQTPSSAPVSSTSKDGKDSFVSPISPTTVNTPTTTPLGDTTELHTLTREKTVPNRPSSVEKPGSEQGKLGQDSSARQLSSHCPPTVLPVTPEKSAQPATSAAPSPSVSIVPPAGLPEDYDPMANITPAQVRIWAEARGCDKTRARVELGAFKRESKAAAKVADRAARISLASGVEYVLPVVVERDGTLTEQDAATGVEIVRMLMGRAGGRLTVDVEHTGFGPGHQLYRLRTVQLGTDRACVIFDPVVHAQEVRALLGEAAALVAHSGQADIVPLAHAGLCEFEEAMSRLSDTAVRARLSDPQVTGSDGDLKKTAPTILGGYAVTPLTEDARKGLFAAGGWLTETEIDTPYERSGWAQSSPTGATMLRYAGGDVLDTAAIDTRIPALPDWLIARERDFQRMTARITHHGVPLRYEHIRELEARHSPERVRLGGEIGAFRVENPGSSKQLAEAFTGLGVTLPLTEPDKQGRGGGNPSVAEDVMATLIREHPGTAPAHLAQLVLDWRHHDTALGTFIRPYKALCEHGDGRARPTLYTVGTNTGRTSCVRPNAQQLPRQGEFRAMYGADEGMVIIRADFSGVEVRGAGALSGDQTLLESIQRSDADPKSKLDIHWLVAKMAYGPEATKEHRYVSKRAVFTRMYGGKAPTIAKQLAISLTEASVIQDSLITLTPRYQQWTQELIELIKAGQTSYQTYSGRIVWIPQPWARKGPNFAIQGTCREILVDATVDRWRTTKWGGCMILPVHDELLAWVPAEDAHEATAALVACMTSTLTGPTGATVPIRSEPDDPDPVTGRWTGFTAWPDAS